VSFQAFSVGFPQDGLSRFQRAFQSTKRSQPALEGKNKFL